MSEGTDTIRAWSTCPALGCDDWISSTEKGVQMTSSDEHGNSSELTKISSRDGNLHVHCCSTDFRNYVLVSAKVKLLENCNLPNQKERKKSLR